jgi:hypothetical protein
MGINAQPWLWGKRVQPCVKNCIKNDLSAHFVPDYHYF